MIGLLGYNGGVAVHLPAISPRADLNQTSTKLISEATGSHFSWKSVLPHHLLCIAPRLSYNEAALSRLPGPRFRSTPGA